MKVEPGDFFQGRFYKSILLGQKVSLSCFSMGEIHTSFYDEKTTKESWIKLGWIDLNA